jgi:hypothetical protein
VSEAGDMGQRVAAFDGIGVPVAHVDVARQAFLRVAEDMTILSPDQASTIIGPGLVGSPRGRECSFSGATTVPRGKTAGERMLATRQVGTIRAAILAALWIGMGPLAPNATPADDSPLVQQLLAGCPDPAIIASREDGKFYIFCTGRGIPMAEATPAATNADRSSWGRGSVARRHDAR